MLKKINVVAVSQIEEGEGVGKKLRQSPTTVLNCVRLNALFLFKDYVHFSLYCLIYIFFIMMVMLI